jgi:hypothetical protein
MAVTSLPWPCVPYVLVNLTENRYQYKFDEFRTRCEMRTNQQRREQT